MKILKLKMNLNQKIRMNNIGKDLAKTLNNVQRLYHHYKVICLEKKKFVKKTIKKKMIKKIHLLMMTFVL